MAGLVPAIYVLRRLKQLKDVGARHKAGHDGLKTPMTTSRIRRLSLTHFRSYRAASLEAGADLVALVGPNGAGKTNCLEAISLLMPGRGFSSPPLGGNSR